jgi:hypothetical protein
MTNTPISNPKRVRGVEETPDLLHHSLTFSATGCLDVLPGWEDCTCL